MKRWVGVDLDGTLAHDQFGSIDEIGKPVKQMVELVKDLLRKGHHVKIFTARANPVSYDHPDELKQVIAAIETWTLQHIGEVLEVTCSKDYAMIALFDDRAWRVERNSGRVIGWGDGNQS